MEEKKLYEYNSGLSFGPGAEHFSIVAIDDKYFRKDGTPQEPSKMMEIYLSRNQVKEIKGLIANNHDNAQYIKHVLLRG